MAMYCFLFERWRHFNIFECFFLSRALGPTSRQSRTPDCITFISFLKCDSVFHCFSLGVEVPVGELVGVEVVVAIGLGVSEGALVPVAVSVSTGVVVGVRVTIGVGEKVGVTGVGFAPGANKLKVLRKPDPKQIVAAIRILIPNPPIVNI